MRYIWMLLLLKYFINKYSSYFELLQPKMFQPMGNKAAACLFLICCNTLKTTHLNPSEPDMFWVKWQILEELMDIIPVLSKNFHFTIMNCMHAKTSCQQPVVVVEPKSNKSRGENCCQSMIS